MNTIVCYTKPVFFSLADLFLEVKKKMKILEVIDNFQYLYSTVSFLERRPAHSRLGRFAPRAAGEHCIWLKYSDPYLQSNNIIIQFIIFIYRIMRTTRKWSIKYKKSIDCNNPKGFSQKQHCKYGRTKKRKMINKKYKPSIVFI
jgi:hypothetical protein